MPEIFYKYSITWFTKHSLSFMECLKCSRSVVSGGDSKERWGRMHNFVFEKIQSVNSLLSITTVICFLYFFFVHLPTVALGFDLKIFSCITLVEKLLIHWKKVSFVIKFLWYSNLWIVEQWFNWFRKEIPFWNNLNFKWIMCCKNCTYITNEANFSKFDLFSNAGYNHLSLYFEWCYL